MWRKVWRRNCPDGARPVPLHDRSDRVVDRTRGTARVPYRMPGLQIGPSFLCPQFDTLYGPQYGNAKQVSVEFGVLYHLHPGGGKGERLPQATPRKPGKPTSVKAMNLKVTSTCGTLLVRGLTGIPTREWPRPGQRVQCPSDMKSRVHRVGGEPPVRRPASSGWDASYDRGLRSLRISYAL